MFLWDEVNDVLVLDKLFFKLEVGILIYVIGVILYLVSREDVVCSGMNKFVGFFVYKYMMVRNVNMIC